jgi:hypothetical protein
MLSLCSRGHSLGVYLVLHTVHPLGGNHHRNSPADHADSPEPHDQRAPTHLELYESCRYPGYIERSRSGGAGSLDGLFV